MARATVCEIVYFYRTMKKFLLFVIAISVLGCKHFETRKLSSDQIFHQELEQIDWKNLDAYPSVDACKDASTKKAQQQCFGQAVSRHIYKVLNQHKVVLKDSIHQEIELIIAISDKGKAVLNQVQLPAEVSRQIPEIKKWLQEAVESLPKIYPAKKRGVPVSSKFKLPLLIQSD